MEIIFAGFGGQGVLTSGLVLANIALGDGYKVLWSPAYGGAMRGGKSFSLVKFSREEICEPVVTALDAAVIMNQPSLSFLDDLKEDGIAILNSDVIDADAVQTVKGTVLSLPFNTLAMQSCGRASSANIVSIGALIRASGLFGKTEALDSMCRFFEEKGKGKFNEANVLAFNAGYDYIKIDD